MKYVLYMCSVMLFGTNLVNGTETNCSSHWNQSKNGSSINIPVLRFCTDARVSKETVITLDGYYANTLDGGQTCTCTARALFETASKLEYKDLLYPSSFENNSACGSKILFRQPNFDQRLKYCKDDGHLPVNKTVNITVAITLIKENHPQDTRYCLRINFDQSNPMEIKCNSAADDESVTTTEKYDTETTPQSRTERTILEKRTTGTVFALKTSIRDATTAVPESMTDIDSSKDKVAQPIQNEEKEDLYIVYVAIGCGAGGLIFTAVVAIYVIQKLRQKKRQISEDNHEHTDDDDYGIMYNTLYVSNYDNDVQQTVNNQQEICVTESHTAYKIDRNYSKKDLNEKPETKPESNTNERKCDNNMEGDYAGIDTEEIVSRYEGKYTEATKSGSKATPELTPNWAKNAESFAVKHIIAPGEDGCAYAVVEKSNSDNCRNDVYAVVDNTRKKKS